MIPAKKHPYTQAVTIRSPTDCAHIETGFKRTMAKEKAKAEKSQSNSPRKGQIKSQQSNKKKDWTTKKPPQGMTQERFDRLVAEAQAPYKGFRKFIYGSIGASGAIGGFVFFTKILAGRDIAASLPNLALQLGIVALMVFLFRWEDRDKKES